MTRKVTYITGTRADFGLMRRTLREIDARPDLSLTILATGMHFDPQCGLTFREIESAGFSIGAQIIPEFGGDEGGTMARAIATMIEGFTTFLEVDRPDIVLLLGDRGEMLAGAIAAIHLDIPVAHIHGGERSGTIDEPVRHAISKLAHFHFAATAESAERLARMGEDPSRIRIVGAPGLVGLNEAATLDRKNLADTYGLDPTKEFALFVFHPIVQNIEDGAQVVRTTFDNLTARGLQIVALRPNSDSGSAAIRAELDRWIGHRGIAVLTHLPRMEFVSFMAAAKLMVGNSSAGIIEAGFFGTPVVNIGARQNLRERNPNVVDAHPSAAGIDEGIARALAQNRKKQTVYGDGKSHVRIADSLSALELEGVTAKVNAY